MRSTWADALERVRLEIVRQRDDLAAMTKARDELVGIAMSWVTQALMRDDEVEAARSELADIAKLAAVGRRA